MSTKATIRKSSTVSALTTRKKPSLSKADTLSAYLLCAPFLLFFLAFVAYPVIQNVYYSFTNYNLNSAPKFIWFKNYARLFKDDVFLQAMGNTTIYALFSVIGLLLLGLAAALALNSVSKWTRGARTLLLYPYATSMIAVSMVWLLLLDPTTGYVNKFLSALHLPTRTWLFDKNLALGCLIFINVWKNLGYCMLIILSGLQGIDTALYEAARVDGASSFGQLRHITLPSLRPVLLFVSVTSCVESFKTFEQVQTMTRGDPLHATTTIVHQIYLRGFGEFKMGYAAAMSVILLVILMIVTALNFRAYGGEE